jgi:hypothetical protein
LFASSRRLALLCQHCLEQRTVSAMTGEPCDDDRRGFAGAHARRANMPLPAFNGCNARCRQRSGVTLP